MSQKMKDSLKETENWLKKFGYNKLKM